MMGLPFPIVDAIGSGLEAKDRTAKQNSAIGNSFHVPSVMIMLLVLFQLTDANRTVPAPMLAATECELHSRVSGTVFDMHFLIAHGDTQSAKQLAHEMFELMPSVAFPKTCR